MLGQISSLDSSLSAAIEAYNSATARLEQVRADLQANTVHLAIAKKSLRRSQQVLSARLVALYTSGDDQSTLSVLLGATSLDDFISRLETVDRVSEQDADVVREVVDSKAEVQHRQERLRRARAWVADLVAERAAHKQSIEQQLAERRALVSSIRAEIEQMREEERRRQAELARQAEERAQQAATAPSFSPSTSTGSTSSESSSSAPDPSGAPAVSAPSRGGVVGIAMQYLGTPYVWAGASTRAASTAPAS